MQRRIASSSTAPVVQPQGIASTHPDQSTTCPRPDHSTTPTIKHVVQYSGGIGSWATAMRVKAEFGTDNLILLSADTKAEDPGLSRFVADSSTLLGVEPIVVADGRTPWQVFADQRFVGNSRIAPCSAHLKQKPCRAWLNAHADPATTILYVGIDWNGQRRVPAIEKGWAPWPVRFPMCEPPYLSKQDMLDWARAEGLRPPRLYEQGFAHNNFYWTTAGRDSSALVILILTADACRARRSTTRRNLSAQ